MKGIIDLAVRTLKVLLRWLNLIPHQPSIHCYLRREFNGRATNRTKARIRQLRPRHCRLFPSSDTRICSELAKGDHAAYSVRLFQKCTTYCSQLKQGSKYLTSIEQLLLIFLTYTSLDSRSLCNPSNPFHEMWKCLHVFFSKTPKLPPLDPCPCPNISN